MGIFVFRFSAVVYSYDIWGLVFVTGKAIPALFRFVFGEDSWDSRLISIGKMQTTDHVIIDLLNAGEITAGLQDFLLPYGSQWLRRVFHTEELDTRLVFVGFFWTSSNSTTVSTHSQNGKPQ